MRPLLIVCLLLPLTGCSTRKLPKDLTVEEYTRILKEDSDAQKRGEAAEALGERGEAARASVPALLEAMKDEGTYRTSVMFPLRPVGEGAAKALHQIGGEEVAGALADKLLADEKVSARARNAFGMLSPPARAAALPGLVKAVEQRDKQAARKRAAEVVGSLGPAGKTAIPVLAKALADADPELRAALIVALRETGKGRLTIVCVNYSEGQCKVTVTGGWPGSSPSPLSPADVLPQGGASSSLYDAEGPYTIESVTVEREGKSHRHELNTTVPGGQTVKIKLDADDKIELISVPQ